MSNSNDLHALSGGYALDALSEEEAAEFEKHLAECVVCSREVREFRAAAASMGASESVAPPAHLRARVLAAADEQRQLPPIVGRPPATRVWRWWPQLIAVAAAAILVVGGIAGVRAFRGPSQQPMAAPVAKVFHAPDAHSATVKTANGGKITVATSASLNEMAVDTDHLPQLDKQRVYQLWTLKNSTPAPAGLLKDVEAGKAMGMPTKGVRVAITIEPAGGSPQPTTKPIVVLDPSAV